jgi:hypothetical protein
MTVGARVYTAAGTAKVVGSPFIATASPIVAILEDPGRTNAGLAVDFPLITVGINVNTGVGFAIAGAGVTGGGGPTYGLLTGGRPLLMMLAITPGNWGFDPSVISGGGAVW